jgi:hypothetical protein
MVSLSMPPALSVMVIVPGSTLMVMTGAASASSAASSAWPLPQFVQTEALGVRF